MPTTTTTPSVVPPPPIIKTVFGVERNIEASDFPSEDEINALESMLPKGCIHGWFPSTYQNKQLHYRKWIPKSSNPPKAIVIFMHGISTHSVKYVQLPPPPPNTEDTNNDAPSPRWVSTQLMIDTFVTNDIAVYAYDLYGHGYSEGVRFFIPESYHVNVQDYIQFCHLVVAKDHPTSTAPIFFMGESYGCTIVLHAAKYFQDHSSDPEKQLPNFDSLILTAPAIIGDLPIYPVVVLLTWLGKYYPTWRPFFMPNPVSPDRIWKDPLVRECYCDKTKPANVVDGSGIPFRLGTGVQLLRALEDVRTNIIPQLTTPYMVIHGTEDHGVPISGSEYLYKNSLTASDQKEFIQMEHAYHDLLADPTAEISMTHIMNWMDRRIALRAAGK